MGKPILKSITSFKSETIMGEKVKIYIHLFESGICLIYKLIWTSRHLEDKIVTQRFGKCLYVESIGFKADTLENINYIVNGKANK